MERASARRRTVQNTAVLMAGWLFADLMLVLFVVGVGSQPTAYPAPLQTSATPSPTATPTPTRPPTLSKEPVTLRLKVDFGGLMGSRDARKRAAADLKKKVTAELKRRKLTANRAGMVLIFSSHQDSDVGVARSGRVADELPKVSGGFFGDAAMRPFWRGERGQSFNVELEIYLIE